jgi:GNAT superfamily N-acetyltransferase
MPNLADFQIEIANGIVVIKNQNTTIGYSRFTSAGDVEYIYVNPMYRRQGYGTLLLDEIRRIAGQIGAIHTLVSPLGTTFFEALDIDLPDPTIAQPDAKAR